MPASGTSDTSGEWQLASGSLDGAPIGLVDGHPITLLINGDQMSGDASCSSYSGPIAITGGTVVVGDVIETLMACVDKRRMAAETSYLSALKRVSSIARAGTSLTLSGNRVELRFIAQSPR
jgi:heat shock protein HslJ